MATAAIFTTPPAAAGCSNMSFSTTPVKQLVVPVRSAPRKQKLKNTPYAPMINCVQRVNTPNTAGANSSSSSSIFHSAIGDTRADWLNTCAILSSQANDSSSSSSDDQSHQLLPAPNDREHSGDGASSVDLVPVNGTRDNNIVQRRPLSISDLAPAPMHGSELRVAYQGVPGAYSEAAAAKAYPGCEAVPCDQFDVAFQSVELWIADRAVLPVENSLGGSIHRNYDLLLRHRLHIVGEVQLPVHHCLLALPGVRKEQITRVMSHPQALAQCEHTLTNRVGLGTVVREAYDDTAAAAEYVAANGLRDTAAIASARAAELYGLQVVADGIQDDKSNVTRFVMLAREPVVPRTDRPFKTSIVFAQDDAARDRGTSVLFKVLSAFAFRDISLTKIESRPHRQQPLRLVGDTESAGTAKHFEYMFYIDFQASLAEARAQRALAEIQEFTSFLRVLGSYPMDMTPWIHTAESFNNGVVHSASASNSPVSSSTSSSSSPGQ